MFGTKRNEASTTNNVVQFITDRATLDRARDIVKHYHEFQIGDGFALYQDRGDKVTWHLKNGDVKKAITITREQLAGFVHVAIAELQRTEAEALEMAREAREQEMAAKQAFVTDTPEPVVEPLKRRGDPIKWGDRKNGKGKTDETAESLPSTLTDVLEDTESEADNAS